MLPRTATTTGTVQPSPALPAGTSGDAAVKPPPSAATLANLRAEVLLRLIETLLKHMPRSGEPNPNRDLLETLFAALKTLPGREGENGRKLADLLAKLPAELRPSVEKLIGTVLSSMPTRNLVEIVRNPNGPEAQKLAAMLATSLNLPEDTRPAGADRQQKPVGLTAQQLAAVGRHGPQQTATGPQLLSDARALQTTLKRLFDLEGSTRQRVMTARVTETATGRLEQIGPHRLPAGATPDARIEPRLPTPITRAGEQPVEAAKAVIQYNGSEEETQTATPAAKREEISAKAQIANAAGQALARSVLHAVARDLPPILLMQAVEHLVTNLSPEEADFLRAILERPLDAMIEQDAGFSDIEPPAPEETAPETLELQAELEPEHEAMNEPVKARPETTQSVSVPARPAIAQAEPQPASRNLDTPRPVLPADGLPDFVLPAPVLRDGVPLAFVPYLPAEEELEGAEAREAEEDEATAEEQTDGEGEGGDGAQEDADFEATGDEPETADMALRREKTADMVGVIEPGLVFYQKLGEYWT